MKTILFYKKILTVAALTVMMLGCNKTDKANAPDFDTAKQTQSEDEEQDGTQNDNTDTDENNADQNEEESQQDNQDEDTAEQENTDENNSNDESNNNTDSPSGELLLNNDFESGTTEHWSTNDGVSNFSASDELAYSGSYSGKITGRTANWNAPLQNLMGKLVSGKSYDISAWVRLANADSSQINLSLKLTENSQDKYIGIAQAQANNESWVKVSGQYTYTANSPSDLFVYIEGPDSNVDYYIDDVSIKLDPLSDLTEFSAVTATTLKNIKPLPIGVAVPAGTANNSILNSEQRAEIVKQYFTQLSAENIMKMSFLQPSQGNFTFSNADELVNFANNNGLSVHGHVLVWHSQVPNWMRDFQGDKAAWINIMENHVQRVASHFSGKLTSWDVVNEAFNEDGSYRSAAVDSGHGVDQRQASIWHQNIGDEFIERAFKTAHEADTNAELYYNDYNISWNEAKLDAIVAMAKDFKSRGIPIDGIGFQLHINESNPSAAQFAKQLQKVVNLGLKVKITELDIQMNHSANATELTPYIAERQKQRFFEIISTYLSTVPVNLRGGITVWGVSDSDSWITGLTGNTDWPLLFDDEFNAKPALQGFADALNQTEDPAEPVVNLIENSDFEKGNTHHWFGHGPTIVTLEDTEAHSGLYSAKASGRTDNWNGIGINANLVAGKTYRLSAWVKLTNADNDVASLSVKLTDDAGDHYSSAAYQVAVSHNEWTQLTGTYTHTVIGADAGHYIYIEGPASNVDFIIDDVSVIEVSE